MKPTVAFLKNIFNEYNTIAFNNELPNIDIVLSKTKAYGMYLVRYKFGSVINRCIKISTLLDRDEFSIRTTMVHEMIHYYIDYKNIHDNGSHGYKWQSIARKLSNQLGMHITQYTALTDDEKTSLPMQYYKIVEFEYGGRKCYSRIGSTTPLSLFTNIRSVKNIKLYTIKSNNVEYQMMRQVRKNITYYYLDQMPKDFMNNLSENHSYTVAA